MMPTFQQQPPGPGMSSREMAEWLISDEEMMRLDEGLTRLKASLGEGGTDLSADNAKGTEDAETQDPAPASSTQEVTAKIQYLYGDDLGRGCVNWKAKPTHPDGPKSDLINKDSGYVVRKTSQGVNYPWEMHSVIVRSPHIMKILRQILPDYPESRLRSTT